MQVYNLDVKKPIKMWLYDIEDGAMEQAINLANLPYIYKHIALMPDCHKGYGMPIGGVMATDDVIVPNAVGLDIGCGMRCFKTDLKEITKEQLIDIMGSIRNNIPVGFKHQQSKQEEWLIEDEEKLYLNTEVNSIITKEYESSLYQLGTLGGGNHFIEIQKDVDGFIWVMVHSGSRNLGKKVAEYHNNIAKDLNDKWYSIVDPKVDMAFLPVDGKEGKTYITEMNMCIKFAKLNRKIMIERIKGIMTELFPEIRVIKEYSAVHNYASLEHHFGKNVWVHRKGAILAREGVFGIIPGSQGTNSYIVCGRGNQDSFMSCSHGAGRRMGCEQAKKTLDMEEEKAKLNGILHTIRGKSDLDEAPGAYKNIETVMKNQMDLINIVDTLKPLACIKG